MKQSTRRLFMLQVAAASTVGLATVPARAQGGAMVNEKDAQAMALGYAADTTRVDARKYPRHAEAQKCSGCQLYTGKPGDAAGGCGIFPGKQVAANGWCSAYVKKS